MADNDGAVRIPVPQPPTVQTMSATPQTLHEMFTVTRTLQNTKYRAYAKLIGGATAVWLLCIAMLWSLDTLNIISQTAGLYLALAAAIVSIMFGIVFGLPDFLAAREMLAVVPKIKEILWQQAEVTINDLTGLNLDLDNDGQAESSAGGVSVSLYTDRLNGQGVRIDTNRLMLGGPFSLKFSVAQVMEFIKQSMSAPNGFTRDKTWCPPNQPTRTILDGTIEELHITRPVYDQLMRALSDLRIVAIQDRQKGYQLIKSPEEIEAILKELVEVKRTTEIL